MGGSTSLPELAPEHERQRARDQHRSTGQHNAQQQQGRHRLCTGRTEGQHGRDATGLRHPQVGWDGHQNQNERGNTIDNCCLLKVEALDPDRSPQEDEGHGRAAEGDRGREQSTLDSVQREERPGRSQDAAQAAQDRQERPWHGQAGLQARRIG
jgi:hypothetical protein